MQQTVGSTGSSKPVHSPTQYCTVALACSNARSAGHFLLVPLLVTSTTTFVVMIETYAMIRAIPHARGRKNPFSGTKMSVASNSPSSPQPVMTSVVEKCRA